jgi:hypothetical protein
MADACEYKVVELREKLIGGKLSGAKLEKLLNDHAADGWTQAHSAASGWVIFWERGRPDYSQPRWRAVLAASVRLWAPSLASTVDR